MRYAGGKVRQAAALAEQVRARIKYGQTYYEPFCGAMGSALKCVPAAFQGGAVKAVLSDSSKPLMTMWKHAFDGWVPPARVTRTEYMRLRETRDPADPMTAFAGFGCGFGGKYFGAFGCKGDAEAARRARDGVLKKVKTIDAYNVHLRCIDYLKVRPRNAMLYLDPPYVSTTRVHSHNHDRFNVDEFWNYARALVHDGNTVIVTGYEAPDDFVPVHSWGNTVPWQAHREGNTGRQYNECIFMLRGTEQ